MENPGIDFPKNVQEILSSFVESAQSACGSNLKSVTLYGSAAEGHLRATSDVNIVLILGEFNIGQVDALRESLRIAHAAIQLHAMFLLESEIPIATQAFAVKFADIFHRHRVLYGEDFFKNFAVSREATIERLVQILINLKLRLRQRYALVSLREEQLSHVIADVAGPLRVCADTILRLEGVVEPSPKQALQNLTQRLAGASGVQLLESISAAREKRELKNGEASATLVGLLGLLQVFYAHVQGVR